MAKRISSIFSLSKDDSGSESNASVPPSTSTLPLAQSPAQQKLHRHRVTASSELTLEGQTPITPLAPPPLLTSDGFVRPPSSAGTGSRPVSRAGSPQSTGSRSRPATPSLLIPGDNASSSRPSTPTSTKLNKRRSWLPGSRDRGKNDNDPKRSKAWIAGLKDQVPYDLTPLLNGERVGA